MSAAHPINQRVPNTFPPFLSQFQVDRSKFMDWNEASATELVNRANTDLESNFLSP